jgi:hypothetical protein
VNILLKEEALYVLDSRWQLGRVVRNKIRQRYSEASAIEIYDVLQGLVANGKAECRLCFDAEYGVGVAQYKGAL